MAKKTATLKGFRDLLPAELAVRQRAKKIITQVFESFGFQPLETPALEYQSVLLGKYGQEADKLVYTFQDKGKRQIGLRYDLTVPLARVAATYQTNLSTPFKRYQIQPVWRADKPQQGRYREFEQCDFDILNSGSPLADAEIIAVTNTCLLKLGFKDFKIKINSRKLLYTILKQAKIEKNKWNQTLQSLDKLDKLSEKEVKQDLIKKAGLKQPVLDQLFNITKKIKSSLIKESTTKIPFASINQPTKELKAIIKNAIKLGVDKKNIVIDLTLARGLDYYTGPIFEAVVTKPNLGSLAGGGRYDNLIKDLGGPDWPAVGASLGLDRICQVIQQNQLWPDLQSNQAQVLVTIFDQSTLKQSAQTAAQLRQAGINTELYLEPDDRLDKQLKYADKKTIPFVVIIGPDEIKTNQLCLKNLSTGKQTSLSLNSVIAKLTHQ